MPRSLTKLDIDFDATQRVADDIIRGLQLKMLLCLVSGTGAVIGGASAAMYSAYHGTPFLMAVGVLSVALGGHLLGQVGGIAYRILEGHRVKALIKVARNA